MDIATALPTKKYVAALNRAGTAEWKQKRDRAIANIREWVSSVPWNRNHLPELLFSYGKDSMACFLLLKMAGVPFRPVTVLNGGDIPQHELVFPEFDRFIGMHGYEHVIHRTSQRYVDILRSVIDWALINDYKPKGKPCSFWNMGAMEDELYWLVADSFLGETNNFADDVLQFSGKRTAEAMDRFYEVQKNGACYRDGDANQGRYSFTWWNAYPISDWRDIDVWALLVSMNCPVSPVYSFHGIPQKGGKQAFPRTYWYPEPVLMNGLFYKWLAKYCPVQLQELNTLFPEIPERLLQRPETLES